MGGPVTRPRRTDRDAHTRRPAWAAASVECSRLCDRWRHHNLDESAIRRSGETAVVVLEPAGENCTSSLGTDYGLKTCLSQRLCNERRAFRSRPVPGAELVVRSRPDVPGRGRIEIVIRTVEEIVQRHHQ